MGIFLNCSRKHPIGKARAAILSRCHNVLGDAQTLPLCDVTSTSSHFICGTTYYRNVNRDKPKAFMYKDIFPSLVHEIQVKK